MTRPHSKKRRSSRVERLKIPWQTAVWWRTDSSEKQQKHAKNEPQSDTLSNKDRNPTSTHKTEGL